MALGSNLGERAQLLQEAIQACRRFCRVLAISPFYTSSPLGCAPGAPDYINAVMQVVFEGSPEQLLDALQAVENEFGRTRPYRNAPRTLDLDIIWIDGFSCDTERLIVPHPRAFERAFVLKPWHDIAPDRVSAEQLAHVADQALSRWD